MRRINPIQTWYHGCKFRSRLEARYAVLFDALGVPWSYEAEGYDTETAGWYLPDFYLHTNKTIVEIKPASDKPKDNCEKPEALAMRVSEGKVPGIERVFVFNGLPDVTGYDATDKMITEVLHKSSHLITTSAIPEGFFAYTDDTSYLIAPYVKKPVNCVRSMMIGLVPYCRELVDKTREQLILLFAKAVLSATSARFEHGETPVIL